MQMRFAFLISVFACVIMAPGFCQVWAQAPRPPGERGPDGVYEITLKTPDRRKIVVEKIIRDRDLDAKAIFRVSAGGYLAFREADWVDEVEFKVFDVPLTALPQYRKFANLLVDINRRTTAINETLRRYDEFAFRLMNICGKREFRSLTAIDQNVVQQLAIYQRLILLRSLVVNALDRLVRERSCVDRFSRYKSDLEIYSKQLTALCKDYERLRQKALEMAEEAASGAGDQATKSEKSPMKKAATD